MMTELKEEKNKYDRMIYHLNHGKNPQMRRLAKDWLEIRRRAREETRTCIICGSKFTTIHATKKTCSKECSYKLEKLNAKKWRKKNPEKVKIQKHDWYQKNPMDPEKKREYYYKNRERILERRKRKYYEEKNEVITILGGKCIICGNEEQLVCHEIPGKPHTNHWGYILKHINDFVRLCKPCHDVLHKAIRYVEDEEKFIELLRNGRDGPRT